MFFSFCLFIVGVTFLLISKWMYNDYFSPIGIMGGVWFFVLSLFHLRLYPFFPLSSFLWACVLGGLLLFFMGCVVATGFNIGKEVNAKQPPYIKIDCLKLYKATKIFWIIGILGFIPLFLRIVMMYGIEGFFTNPEKVHDNSSVRFFGYFWLLNVLTPCLACLYFFVAQKKRIFMVIIILSSILMLLLGLSRTNAIIAMAMMFLSLIYLKVFKHIIRSFVIVTVVVVIFFSFFQFIKDPSAVDRLKESKFKPEILKPFASAYGYITTPLPTFEAMVNDTNTYDYGSNTFVTISKFLDIFIPGIKLPQWPEKFYNNPIRCNVYTYLGPYYKDFGLYGIILFCFIQGVIVMHFYLRMIKFGEYHYFLLNGLLGWCLLISFFSNHFRGNSTLFLCVVSYYAGRYIVPKSGLYNRSMLSG